MAVYELFMQHGLVLRVELWRKGIDMNGTAGLWRKLREGLGDFFHRPMAQQRGVRRWTLLGTTGVLALASLAGGILAMGAIGSGVGVTVSSNAQFCDSCHEIVPAYEQWRISSHRSVNCLTCHTEEGLPGYVKINLEGLKNLATHASGATELPAQASIKRETCLQCHAEGSLPETIPAATLRVSHSSHQELNCTTCHARLVHPVLFDAPALALTRTADHAQKDCNVCHPSPSPTYLHGDAGVACSSCHSGNIPNHDLAVRRSTTLRETCMDCHAQQRVSQPESCQTCHVSPHGFKQNCGQCHASTDRWGLRSFVHPATITGAHEQLQCTKCHAVAAAPAGQALSPGNYLCSTCHTPKHPPMDNNCAKCHNTTGWKPLKGQK